MEVLGDNVENENHSHELGYLRALVESNIRANSELKDEFRDWKEESAKQNEATRAAIQSLKDELNIYKVAVRLVKVVGLILGAMLTFKFGDLSNIWHKFGDGL